MESLDKLPDDELMRVFVAVDLNAEVRKNLEEEQARLRRRVGGVKWTPVESLHLTLVFLGDVFAGQIAGIAAVLDAEAAAVTRFDLEVAGLGLFGPSRTPRIVWAGAGRGADVAATLQKRIAAGLRGLSLTFEDRPFNAHFTLGRVKSCREARHLIDAVAKPGLPSYGIVAVDRVLLMRSELSPGGAVYSRLHESFLACAPP